MYHMLTQLRLVKARVRAVVRKSEERLTIRVAKPIKRGLRVLLKIGCENLLHSLGEVRVSLNIWCWDCESLLHLMMEMATV